MSDDVDRALARLEEDLERLSPLISASVSEPREVSWPGITVWSVRVKLVGQRTEVSAPRFDSEADALAFREGAHEAIGRAT